MAKSYGTFARDQNNVPILSGKKFVTNIGGGIRSVENITTITSIPVPTNAVEFVAWGDGVWHITEQSTVLNGRYAVPANVVHAFGVAGMDSFNVAAASGTVALNFYFVIVD